ncbi:hypothetical protein [Sphingomonas sp. TDK1]|uniref:hypothetical protein n=1 Tax=Sphingomonas sp. TDK1 TaxID=453247 RepID=UPI0007D9164E|nr:hypothetical protein [Sphingomonas sp. TDK1]OAN66630.1 hypothetical protein A7X12_10950 [Sphingomonas sp. TDK1]
MIRVASVVASLALLASPALAAAPCKDAKGKFVKCPTAPAVTKDAKGKCRIASGPKKGQFTPCK